MIFGGLKKKSKDSARKSLADQEKSLMEGYHNMSRINLSLAEEAVQSDNDALFLAEQNLRSVKIK